MVVLRDAVDLMWPGFEAAHLRDMINRVDRRGSDVQLWAGQLDRASAQLAPYPAFRWDWQVVEAYPWKKKQHITILEVLAFLNHIRGKCTSTNFLHKRFFHILDSQVGAAVLTKGRSSSKELNLQLRKCAALYLARDLYPLFAWTLSQWNFADKPSRIWAHGAEW